jgi:hypothetical protein
MNNIGLHGPVEHAIERAIPKNKNYATIRGTETRSHLEIEGVLNNVGLHGTWLQSQRNENYATRSMKARHYERIRVDLGSLFFIQQIGASNQYREVKVNSIRR